MKKNGTTSQLLILMLAGVYVLAACTAKPNHKVGESIQGTYAVYFGQDLTPIGYLTLSSGQYSFASNTHSAQNVKSTESRFFFISQLKGTYYTEYVGSIKANSVLENLDDNDTLAKILFNEASTETQSRGLPNDIVNRTFLIRNNQQGASLYFHSTVSELEFWRIEKSWNNELE